MLTLSILPEDLRLEIVDHLLRSNGQEMNEIHMLKGLSLVCHSLNSTCGNYIFRRYHLDLRRHTWHKAEVYPAGSDSRSWDGDAIKLRLAHLQSKALFVREIHITDEGELIKNSNPPFPAEFVPELLSTLRTLPNVTAIHLTTHTTSERPKTVISADVWNWVLDTCPTTLSLHGYFEQQEGVGVLKRIENLGTLGLHYFITDTTPLFNVRTFYIVLSVAQIISI